MGRRVKKVKSTEKNRIGYIRRSSAELQAHVVLKKVDLTGFEPVTSRVTSEVTLAPHYCALAFDVNKKNRMEENASALKIRPKRSSAKPHCPPVQYLEAQRKTDGEIALANGLSRPGREQESNPQIRVEVTPILTAAQPAFSCQNQTAQRKPGGEHGALPLSYPGKPRAGFEPATSRLTVEVTPSLTARLFGFVDCFVIKCREKRAGNKAL